MNDATKRRNRKFPRQRTSLPAGTSGQAVEQAIRGNAQSNVNSAGSAYQNDAVRPDGGEMSAGERRALLNNLSQPH